MKNGKISRDRPVLSQLGQLKKMKEEEKHKLMMKNLLEMPYVFTRGDGPNGKKIHGFLYSYNRVQEVRIVCVCHGSFHSPAEFVKHSGAKDIVYPLKHIIVRPFPFMKKLF